ncbi:MAG: tetratricopeptide repeat protein [Deltaproteobacteria bacterium]|nr:tetratricopeptide repeat protein [Deltaproteobacteria bacterium]
MRYMKHVFPALLLVMLASCGHLYVKPDGKEALTAEESYRLGSIYESRGERELAMREYRSAAERGYAEAYFAMANIHLKGSEYNEAEDDLLQAIAINPSNGAFYNNLGWLYMETNRLDKAQVAVNEALRADPAKSYAYLDTLGVIQMRRERLAEAQECLNRAASLVPEGEKEGLREIYGHLIELYTKTGDKEKAGVIEEKMKGLQ